MRRIISYLYHKFCKPQDIEHLYLSAIQRDFTRVLSESEQNQRNIAVYNFLQSGWFDQIFAEELKDYVQALFNVCETQKHRDYMHDTINVLLKFEERFRGYGVQPEGKVDFDKFNLNQ